MGRSAEPELYCNFCGMFSPLVKHIDSQEALATWPSQMVPGLQSTALDELPKHGRLGAKGRVG